MSIDVMREVWKHAPFKGGPLLVLLAMADWADDEGGSIFPKVETLAAKARLSVRGAQLALRELEDAGVIEKVVAATGRPGKATEYRIVLERVKNLQGSETGEISDAEGCNSRQRGVQSETGRVQNDAPYIDNHHSIHHKNHHVEPSGAGAPDAAAPSLFPDDQPKPLSPAETLKAAYAAYEETRQRTGWPQMQMRTGARDAALRARLKDAGGLEGWLMALEKAEASDFCCGRAPPGAGRAKAFMADFDFLTTQSKFVKLMEGKYDNRGGPAQTDPGGNISIAARVAARRAAERANGDQPG